MLLVADLIQATNPARSTIFIACSSRVLAVSRPNRSDLRPGSFRVCEIS
jgi:hypothetical protein